MNKEIKPSSFLPQKKDIWRPMAILAIAGSLGFSKDKYDDTNIEDFNQENISSELFFSSQINRTEVTEEIELQDSVVVNLPAQPVLSDDEIASITKGLSGIGLNNTSGVSAAGVGSVGEVSEAYSPPPTLWPTSAYPQNSGKVIQHGESIWVVLADCETGDSVIGAPFYAQWDYNGPSGFDGGMQYSPSTWATRKTGYEFAWQASAEVQIEETKGLISESSWRQQFPGCTAKMINAGYLEQMKAAGRIE